MIQIPRRRRSGAKELFLPLESCLGKRQRCLGLIERRLFHCRVELKERIVRRRPAARVAHPGVENAGERRADIDELALDITLDAIASASSGNRRAAGLHSLGKERSL